METNNYFKFNGEDFAVHAYSKNRKEISIQEYRERFGSPDKLEIPKYITQEEALEFGKTRIDWSKAGQYLTDGFIVVMTMEESNKTNEGNFRGVCIYKQVEKDWEDEVGQYSNNWMRSNFKLCAEPITLENERKK